MQDTLDRTILIEAKVVFDKFFNILNSVKTYYSWRLDGDGVILGCFIPRNECDFGKYFDKTPIDAVAYPLHFDEYAALFEMLSMSYEEIEIIKSGVYNDKVSVYFIPQIRKNLLIELGLNENE